SKSFLIVLISSAISMNKIIILIFKNVGKAVCCHAYYFSFFLCAIQQKAEGLFSQNNFVVESNIKTKKLNYERRMKKVLLVLAIAGMFVMPITLLSPTNLHASSHSIFEKTNTFVVENEENTNYYAVKLYSNQTIYIKEIYVRIEGNQAGTQWLTTNKLLIINFEDNKYLMPPELYTLRGKWLEWYLQIDMGKFNFTLNHLEEKVNNGTATHTVHNLSLPAGTWYLIVIKAPTTKCKITTYINGTNAEIEGVSYGSSAFLIENEDFWAKLNLKTSLLSIIYEGRKTIYINNTFIGFSHFNLGTGIASLEYETPQGENKKCKVWSIFGNMVVLDDSDFYPYMPIIGGKGKWTFRTSLIGMGLGNAVDVLGADIALP
ncbi:MAG: hypothetical protein J7K47_05780, partial [Thermoplasmata archaeon]|nr:hypothetical protein [Thermoplasmata archaeon]